MAESSEIFRRFGMKKIYVNRKCIAYVKGDVETRKIGKKCVLYFKDAISNKTRTVIVDGKFLIV